jgi:hypothetical protein
MEQYPILRMNWINGTTLTRWIDQNIDNSAGLANVARQFDLLIDSLAAAGIAHGDLQHGNLLVADDGSLRLVDYDGIYFPGLDGLPTDEVGHPNYQPPGRSNTDYGPAMDRFSSWLISLSLKAVVADPTLWDKLNPDHDEYLLLNQVDYREPTSSWRISLLLSHRSAEVRELGQRIRDLLPLPLAAMPTVTLTLRVNGSATSTSTDRPKVATPGGLPDWMKKHIPGQWPASARPGTPQGDEQLVPPPSAAPARSVTWLLRTLVALTPVVVGAGFALGYLIGAGVSVAVALLDAVAARIPYRHDPLTRWYTGLRRDRALAASQVKGVIARLAVAEKRGARIEKDAKTLTDRYVKQQAAAQSSHDRKLRQITKQRDTIDSQLAKLSRVRQQQIDKTLVRIQREHVMSWLSHITIDANQVTGVGAQIVANLHSAGIRTAADFSGVSYQRGGGAAVTAYFRLTSGRLVRVAGVGEVKARRIDQWRQGQQANALRRQPTALPSADILRIDAQLAAQRKQLEDERSRMTRLVAKI